MSYTQMSKEELNKDNLIKDVDFIYDAKQFLYDREDYQSEDNEDIYDRYLEHFRYQNVNEVSAVRDMYLAQDYERKGDDEGLARMGRLMSTFENQDTEFTSETVTDYLGGVFTLNLIHQAFTRNSNCKIWVLPKIQQRIFYLPRHIPTADREHNHRRL